MVTSTLGSKGKHLLKHWEKSKDGSVWYGTMPYSPELFIKLTQSLGRVNCFPYHGASPRALLYRAFESSQDKLKVILLERTGIEGDFTMQGWAHDYSVSSWDLVTPDGSLIPVYASEDFHQLFGF